jgi:hypothetical protein
MSNAIPDKVNRSAGGMWRLTVKLRGRPEARPGAEGAQFPSARGAKQEAPHGPLQRLLEGRAYAKAKPRSGATAPSR